MILVPIIVFPLLAIGWGVQAGFATFMPHDLATGFGIAAAVLALIAYIVVRVQYARDMRREDAVRQAYVDGRNMERMGREQLLAAMRNDMLASMQRDKA